MVKKPYVPSRGDIIWMHFSPTRGQEQSGRRPAVVLSPLSYNRKSGMALVVPVTSQVKGYPFEVSIQLDPLIDGAALCDQLRLIDWKVRAVKFIASMPKSLLKEALAKSAALLT